ncbi:hypothetical protein FRC01_003628 [Tulasnella sp. 417]|nr:hypothetical protein FRC01_003628 [Tulasnella sp. 417]
MDELWRSLPSLGPLFKLLGPLVDTDHGLDLRPECILTERSWDLFRSYATRVRSLTYADAYSGEGISTGLIIRALAVHPGGILPNLQAVDWHIGEPGLGLALAFCPPSLERMVIYLGDDEFQTDSARRLLYSLSSSLAHRLKSFEFGTDSSPFINADLDPALNTFLNSQSRLLELNLPYYGIQDSVTVSVVCQASPDLHTFTADVPSVTKEMFREILDELAGRATSLRRVWLTRTGDGLEDETTTLVDIKPMLQLTVIEDIRLWLEGELELTALDIRHMGQAWQGLASLILHPGGGPGIPLLHLTTFAQWFPGLERFAAPFDCTGYIPSADEVPSRFQSLCRLTWYRGQVADAQRLRVAEFLAVVLRPKVELRLRMYGLDSYEALMEMSPWEAGSRNKELQDLIDAFYRVRKAVNMMQ